MFLTDADLFALTQRRRYKAQRRELDRLKVRYLVGSNGRPIVRQSDLDAAGKPAQRRGHQWDRIGPPAGVVRIR